MRPFGVDGDQVPHQLLRDASLLVLPGRIRPRQGNAFLVEWRGTQAVLRSVPVPVAGFPACRLVDDVHWLHAFLSRLTALGFPVPDPLPAFAGASWATAHGVLWELVSFLPGAAVGWSTEPGMEEIGALLARYHVTSRQVAMTGQRPSALPVAEVPAVLLSARLDTAGITADRANIIRQLARQLAWHLRDVGPLAQERLVIHGDFTNDNVIASGTPPRATGVIDFALAHVESPMADIGYALWRSGRPAGHADYLDLGRVRRYLRGYADAVPLSADQASLIPVYLMGRGLQMIAKRIRAGRPEIGMLAQVQWLSANAHAVADVIQAALP